MTRLTPHMRAQTGVVLCRCLLGVSMMSATPVWAQTATPTVAPSSTVQESPDTRTSLDATRQRLAVLVVATPDTPTGVGLVPAALADVRMASQQAKVAEQSPKDLEAMQSAARGVLRALDPALVKEASGGYGVRPAVTAVITQLGELTSTDRKADVARLAPVVLTAAQSVARSCDAAIDVAQRILAATQAEDAAPLTSALSTLVRQLTIGPGALQDLPKRSTTTDGGLLFVQMQLTLLKVGRDAVAAQPTAVPRPPLLTPAVIKIPAPTEAARTPARPVPGIAVPGPTGPAGNPIVATTPATEVRR